MNIDHVIIKIRRIGNISLVFFILHYLLFFTLQRKKRVKVALLLPGTCSLTIAIVGEMGFLMNFITWVFIFILSISFFYYFKSVYMLISR